MRCRNSSPITSASADLDCAGATCEAIGVHNASLPKFGVKKCDDELVVVDEVETDARGLVNCKWRVTTQSGRLSCGDSEGSASLDEQAIDAAIAAIANAPPATTN